MTGLHGSFGSQSESSSTSANSYKKFQDDSERGSHRSRFVDAGFVRGPFFLHETETVVWKRCKRHSVLASTIAKSSTNLHHQ